MRNIFRVTLLCMCVKVPTFKFCRYFKYALFASYEEPCEENISLSLPFLYPRVITEMKVDRKTGTRACVCRRADDRTNLAAYTNQTTTIIPVPNYDGNWQRLTESLLRVYSLAIKAGYGSLRFDGMQVT